MCYEPSICNFDLWYERKCKLDPTYQEWLEQKPKRKKGCYVMMAGTSIII